MASSRTVGTVALGASVLIIVAGTSYLLYYRRRRVLKTHDDDFELIYPLKNTYL
jgi:hypothetical protein